MCVCSTRASAPSIRQMIDRAFRDRASLQQYPFCHRDIPVGIRMSAEPSHSRVQSHTDNSGSVPITSSGQYIFAACRSRFPLRRQQPFHNALDIKSSYLICFKGFIINLHILQSRSSRQCKSPHCRFLQVTSYLPACRNRRKCHHPFRYRNPFRWQYALQRYRSYPYSV